MRFTRTKALVAVAVAALLCFAVALPAGAGNNGARQKSRDESRHGSRDRSRDEDRRPSARHVLLISVDGLHQSDLAWYVQTHAKSTLAGLVDGGVNYSNASTPFPSDSFPGLVGQVTGGDPSSTGVYYDDTWNHAVFPAGTTDCSGPPPGGEVTYFEALDKNQGALDAGQGIVPAPGPDPWANILHMTGNPKDVINPAKLPVDPATCKPIYPNEYLKVNTIFEVAHAASLGDRLVRQAPRVSDPFGSVGYRRRRLLHAGNQQQCQPGRSHRPQPERLDIRQPQDPAIRQLQSAGRHQLDRRSSARRLRRPGNSGHLRDELPDCLDRAETADLEHRREHDRNRDGRLPRRRVHARPGARERARLRRPFPRTHDRRTREGSPARHDRHHRFGQARPVADEPGCAQPHRRQHHHRRAQRRVGQDTRRQSPRCLQRERRRDACVVR